ncbi:hypothetical protein [Bradyrhizobium prioriisuperbiae]|uniref:hypothetical protein n=1 Tax=Bradyrhizobium prioriisuperbiae TaxID=2854389 RepID=UPI0028EDFC7A|nr:hypothetical protein [Bradyrhizobium prioritasuperba]
MLGLIFNGLTTLAGGIITAYNKSKDVSITAIQSATGIAAAQAQAMTAWIGHPLSPPSICCYGVAIWFFKATACDKVIGPALGYSWRTDPLTGGTAEIAMIVVSGMFFSGIANIIKR